MPVRMALYTTVHPGVERFLAPWYRSVLAQTDGDFDLWIGADQVGRKWIENAVEAEVLATYVEAEAGDTPAQIRLRAMERMVERYEGIAFVDSDDILRPTRVEAARQALEAYDVQACTLDIIDESGTDLGVTFAPRAGRDVARMLPQYNVFGLSNSTYRAGVLERCMPFPAGCLLVDWLISTRAWAQGASLSFDYTPRMAYRQYGANIAQVVGQFTGEGILHATGRVLNHYRCVLKPTAQEHELAEPYRSVVREAGQRAELFHNAITGSAALLAEYTDALNKLPVEYIWWWSVAHPELEEIWRR